MKNRFTGTITEHILEKGNIAPDGGTGDPAAPTPSCLAFPPELFRISQPERRRFRDLLLPAAEGVRA